MKTLELMPNQIITLNDYPVYSNKVLIEYSSKCKLGEEIPFVPVIEKKIVKKYLNEKLLKKLEKFEKKNSRARYFMLDGSHRTTALTLAGCKIKVILYEKDKDIIEAKKLVAKGKLIKSSTLNKGLIENCEILNNHFNKRPYFMTVEQKTKKMVKEKILPKDL